jgi:uncharacterized membrane protein
LKINKSKFDVIINILCLLCLVGTAVYLIIAWDKIPTSIPGHYNAAGEVDKMTNKSSSIILLIVGFIMFIGISIIEKFPQIWNTGVQVTEENRDKIYRILKSMSETMKLLVTLVFSYLSLQSTTGENLPPLFLPIYLSLMFGSITFFIIRLVKVK